MAWVKGDDQIHENEKFERISDLAFRLYWYALSWSNYHMTDGHIPVSRPHKLVVMRAPKKTIGDLLREKLWHPSAHPCKVCLDKRAEKKVIDPIPTSGYLIHDYFDYQRPKWVVMAARAQRSEAGRRGGQVKGGGRGSESLTTGREAASESFSEMPSDSLSGSLSEMPSEMLSEKPTPYPVPRTPVSRTESTGQKRAQMARGTRAANAARREDARRVETAALARDLDANGLVLPRLGRL